MKYRQLITWGFGLLAAVSAQASHSGLFFANQSRYVLDVGGVRQWSSGAFANSCTEYKNPALAFHVYSGATGNGTYNVAGVPTYCAMDTPSFEPGTDGGPPLVNNYHLEPNGSELRILNADTNAVLVSSIGNYLNDANNTQVCKLELDTFEIGNFQTFRVSDSCKWLVLKVNTFKLDGQLIANNNSTAGGTFLAQDFNGVVRTYSIVQKLGGAGGNGGNGSGRPGTTALGRAGAAQTQGGGGGGGSGGLVIDIGSTSGTPAHGNFGNSGRSGGSGGSPATYASSYSAVGGSGGSYGLHGQGVYLEIQNLSGSGVVTVAGRNGNNAGSPGSLGCTPGYFCNVGGSGGGGGGAGGSGGKIIHKITSNTSTVQFLVSAGSGGSGSGPSAANYAGGGGLGWQPPTAGTTGGSGEGGESGQVLTE